MTDNIINHVIGCAATALETAKTLKVTSSQAHRELCQSLYGLLDKLFTLKSYQKSLKNRELTALNQIKELESNISLLKQHKSPIELFECYQLPAGTFVYRHRDMLDAHAPYGYFCPHCMHQKGIMPLRAITGRKSIFLECQVCTVRFAYRLIKK